MTDKKPLVICPCCNHEFVSDTSNTVNPFSPYVSATDCTKEYPEYLARKNNIVKLELVKNEHEKTTDL